jgi:hypothetical protein
MSIAIKLFNIFTWRNVQSNIKYSCEQKHFLTLLNDILIKISLLNNYDCISDDKYSSFGEI